MQTRSSLCVSVATDSGEPLDDFVRSLSPSERELANGLPTQRRRRHFVIGRLAARRAIQGLFPAETRTCRIEISSHPEHGPRVVLNGVRDRVRISISHSSRVAVACAWLANSLQPRFAGIDLEYLRPNDVADSAYAFSRRERCLLRQAPEGA